MSARLLSPTRREVLITAAAIGAISMLSSKSKAAAEAASIHPFQFRASDEDLADLKRRVAATRWPDRETVPDQSQGVQLDIARQIQVHWANHDWRKVEARMMAYPHFITEIDGLDIHFIHVKSKHKNALPMIVTHGWPGSVIEQLKIIEPLTDPTAHGGTEADAFDLVVPSLPGYGFSGKPTTPGWEPVRIAKAWATLMERLGYNKYVAQGGDWGNAVTENMALQEPPGLLGIHTNMAATLPPEISKALGTGTPPPGLGPDEKRAFDQLIYFNQHGLGYAIEMNQRPQTLYGIVDSPVGLAAWMLDHDADSHALIARSFSGKPEGITPDDFLDNVTFYWLTNTAVSSGRLYWDNARVAKGGFFDARGIRIPVAVSAFANEIYQAPESWAKTAYPKLLHYGRFPIGCHFAAWEQPEIFVEEMRASFKALRAS
ncbi:MULTISPECIES: epoxide hydrolase family protein [Mesorhizobium]|uniref:Multidrug MFS transporter n=2 Tax=Mesorhizobium TaxID=68287 RepID=A0A1A5IYL8_RHILI|nr:MULTISPECIES: epoxide hydrolase family protein [Mesorhizobium]MBE1711724.1 alpha/beta fold hydrolase [Mesorhizobium japonicum]MBE1717724.1 alpha/beta fold hydrolase [Mesorhizobium japonicum]MUT23631.1 alpha/beta fold hydrolase [Mesorhizobium japonicum]MUT30423.1 alpha/beta fold hydrolase [Mesorhizobium japonicum]OBP69494.1 multidrug MFS transporter [Mesorhizobium loti]